MRTLTVITIVALLVMGCATPDVTVKLKPVKPVSDSTDPVCDKTEVVAVISGNAPGREVFYKSKDVEIRVTDTRTPNPIMDGIGLVKEFFIGIFGRAQLAIGGN